MRRATFSSQTKLSVGVSNSQAVCPGAELTREGHSHQEQLRWVAGAGVPEGKPPGHVGSGLPGTLASRLPEYLAVDHSFCTQACSCRDGLTMRTCLILVK